jgi:hypothetical protein
MWRLALLADGNALDVYTTAEASEPLIPADPHYAIGRKKVDLGLGIYESNDGDAMYKFEFNLVPLAATVPFHWMGSANQYLPIVTIAPTSKREHRFRTEQEIEQVARCQQILARLPFYHDIKEGIAILKEDGLIPLFRILLLHVDPGISIGAWYDVFAKTHISTLQLHGDLQPFDGRVIGIEQGRRSAMGIYNLWPKKQEATK